MILERIAKKHEPQNISTSHELDQFLRGGGGGTNSGVNVNADTAMRASAVYACVRVLAEAVAQLPLIVYRRTDGGKERATSHGLWTLLHEHPNRWQTSFEWREMMLGHLSLRGNFFCYKNMVRGVTRELIPLHPDRMEVEQLRDMSLRYHYTDDQGKSKTYRDDEIFHIRGMSFDGITGFNPIAYQRESIGLYLGAERFGASLFGNGAKPSGVLRHPENLSAEAQKRLKDSVSQSYGQDNANSVMVLEEGMEWQQVGLSNEDAQFLETRKHQRTEIASIFRVPPHMIGDLERATFSNIEQQSIDFVTYSLMPWLRRIEDAIKRDLVPDNSQGTIFAEFLVEGLLRGDTESRQNFYTSMIEHGGFSPNEVREKENMNPREGGDEFYRPANLVGPSDAAPDQGE